MSVSLPVAAALLAVAIMSCPSSASQDPALASTIAATLERRGGEAAEPVEVLRWDRDAIEIRLAHREARPETLRWDEIRAIEGLPAEAAIHRAFGERLWRARTRLDRGDFTLAAPLLEALAEEARGEGSLRERIAIEGVLRARIRAGAAEAAILAGLRALELDRAGVRLPADAIAPSPRLAALDWPEGAAILPLEGVLDEEAQAAWLEAMRGFAGGAVAGEAAAIASAALGAESGAGPRSAGDTASELEALARSLAAIRGLPADEALAAREGLVRDATPIGRWRLAQLGERLLAEPDPDTRRRGLLEWLAIAALEPQAPEARLALRRAALAADALGEDDLAAKLADRAAAPTAFIDSDPRSSGTRP